MIRFVDDDEGYLAWVVTHPDGLILNVGSSRDLEYVVFYRAFCSTISDRGRQPGAYTGRGYQKGVSTTTRGDRAGTRGWFIVVLGKKVDALGMQLIAYSRARVSLGARATLFAQGGAMRD